MKSKNICKFTQNKGTGTLTATRFIFETENPFQTRETALASDKLLLVVSGEGTVRNKNGSFPITVGTLVFFFAGEKCVIDSSGSLSYMYIDCKGERLLELYKKFGVSEKSFIFPNMSSLIPVWREAIVNADGENIELLCESMILYTFSRLKLNPTKKDTTIHIVTEYIEENFSSPTLSLSTMADDLGYNAKYLSHIISKELSVCFSDYLRDLRMKNAVMLIEEGVTSIKNLALLSGYSSPLYFSKAFKQSFGKSPRSYIEDKNKTIKEEKE